MAFIRNASVLAHRDALPHMHGRVDFSAVPERRAGKPGQGIARPPFVLTGAAGRSRPWLHASDVLGGALCGLFRRQASCSQA